MHSHIFRSSHLNVKKITSFLIPQLHGDFIPITKLQQSNQYREVKVHMLKCANGVCQFKWLLKLG